MKLKQFNQKKSMKKIVTISIKVLKMRVSSEKRNIKRKMMMKPILKKKEMRIKKKRWKPRKFDP